MIVLPLLSSFPFPKIGELTIIGRILSVEAVLDIPVTTLERKALVADPVVRVEVGFVPVELVEEAFETVGFNSNDKSGNAGSSLITLCQISNASSSRFSISNFLTKSADELDTTEADLEPLVGLDGAGLLGAARWGRRGEPDSRTTNPEACNTLDRSSSLSAEDSSSLSSSSESSLACSTIVDFDKVGANLVGVSSSDSRGNRTKLEIGVESSRTATKRNGQKEKIDLSFIPQHEQITTNVVQHKTSVPIQFDLPSPLNTKTHPHWTKSTS